MKTLFSAMAVMSACVSISLADAGGDAFRGEEIFKQCVRCHMVGGGAFNRTGPHLNDIFDRAAGQVDDFRYSGALAEAAQDGLVWDYDSLDVFITSPRDFLPGTRMSFRGLPDQQDRDDVSAYLRQFSAHPANIPEAAPTAPQVDHGLDPDVLAIVGDPAYGEYLSGECTSCHQLSGTVNGMPNITNWPEKAFMIEMHAFKTGTREHPVMRMIAGRLSNEEIAALAAYFSGIE